jgi:pSer/pThr/pTyr-binding forkhead associated (FHA) protein
VHVALSHHHGKNPYDSGRRALAKRDPSSAGYLLLDKGSHNGTRVDGRKLPPLSPQRLSSGTTVELGGVHFWFLSSADMFSHLCELHEPRAGKELPSWSR